MSRSYGPWATRSRFFLLPQEVVRGRWSEVARTTGITTSAQTRVNRGGDDESRCRRLETKMTSEVTCSAGETSFECVSDTREAYSACSPTFEDQPISHHPQSTIISSMQATSIAHRVYHTYEGRSSRYTRPPSLGRLHLSRNQQSWIQPYRSPTGPTHQMPRRDVPSTTT